MHSSSLFFPLASLLTLAVTPLAAHGGGDRGGQENRLEHERDDYNLYYQNRKNVREGENYHHQEMQEECVGEECQQGIGGASGD